jgi:hypothetical protein
MDLALNLPKPCDLGSYSTGGTLEAPNGTCRPCPPGYTTQTDQSVGDWECNGELQLQQQKQQHHALQERVL